VVRMKANMHRCRVFAAVETREREFGTRARVLVKARFDVANVAARSRRAALDMVHEALLVNAWNVEHVSNLLDAVLRNQRTVVEKVIGISLRHRNAAHDVAVVKTLLLVAHNSMKQAQQGVQAPAPLPVQIALLQQVVK